MIFIFLLGGGKELDLCLNGFASIHSPVSQPCFIKAGYSSLLICYSLLAALNLGIFAAYLHLGVMAVQILLAWPLVCCVQQFPLCCEADKAARDKDGSWSSRNPPAEGGARALGGLLSSSPLAGTQLLSEHRYGDWYRASDIFSCLQ